ncbi:MAG: hypothetical protein KDA87_03130 [Planctomycetales bacterium]|nr:hypothetical protein [Planctomycetales bacterium]
MKMRPGFIVYFVLAWWVGSVQAQLVGYWNFDDNVLDISGTGNDGELMGAQYSADVPAVLGQGKSLEFGAPEEHVLIPASESLNSSIFTLSMFIKDGGQFSGINRLTSRAGDTFETGIDLVFGTNSLSYYSPSSAWNTTTVLPELDEWQHVAYVADGQNMAIYLDGSLEAEGPFTSSPTGFMHIGNRHNNVEGFFGQMDDVALWNVVLPESSILALASGTSPLEVEAPDPPPPPVEPIILQTVVSNIDLWKQSTQVDFGGDLGEWFPDETSLPAADTYTLEPLPTASDLIGHIHNAADVLDADGILADPGIQYFRTTFDLEQTSGFTTNIQLAVDNGAQLYINGEFVAEEVSFVVENWNSPLPSVDIDATGAIVSEKFDTAAASFNGWQLGENEIVLAIRNPDPEGAPAGGFAFRMDLILPNGMPGDFNLNGELDVEDIDLLTAASASGDGNVSFDLTNDGKVDDADVSTWAVSLKNTWIGDANVDGEFNSSDFVQVFTAGKFETNQSAVWSEGDWNGDGFFNSSDFVVAFTDGGFELGPRSEVAAVPEPTTAVTFMGLLGILALRRRTLRIKFANALRRN